MATGTLVEGNNAKNSASAEQLDAWAFYGLPKSYPASSEVKRGRQVGEVRYVVGWSADQMSRMGWRVLVNGSDNWSLRVGEQTIASNGQQDDFDKPDHPMKASADLLEAVGWRSSTVRQVTTNLYVAGECEYVALSEGGKELWEVISVIHPQRAKRLEKALHRIRGLIPHPADPESPDAPIFGVLPILEDIDWLNRLSRSQSSNRVGMRGILGVAEGITIANGTGSDSFWDDLNDMIHEPMKDPDDAGMAVLRGPKELIEQSGNGMKGLSLLVPNFPYDDKVDTRMEKLIKRLAYGLPIPPEVLTGAQATSRATAFQIEESSYRAHIEPMAERIARVPEEALRLILPDAGTIDVEPDPTAILARRHSIQDALELFDRGAVSFAYLRQIADVPSSAAPDEDDWELRKRVSGAGDASVPADPGDAAATEPIETGDGAVVAAAQPTFATILSDEMPTREDVSNLEELSEALEHIDAILLSELGGATQQATERVREKLGAAVRSSEAGRSSIPADIPNIEVAAKLGADGLQALGVNVEAVTLASISSLLEWWDDRVTGAQLTITNLLGENLAPQFTPNLVVDSVDALAAEMQAHVAATLTSKIAQPLSAAKRVGVISIAGGAR